jgi:hypothetical protein
MVVDSTMAVLTTASQLAKFTAGNQFWQLVMADEASLKAHGARSTGARRRGVAIGFPGGS